MFEELDYCPTPSGALSLRRRYDVKLGEDVWEILLGDEFLMSSHFTASEVALGQLGVAACQGTSLDVVVGGLGLGYTADAVLGHNAVAELVVVELFKPVIEWHESGVLPMGTRLADAPNCRLMDGDFFAMASGEGFDPDQPGRRFDAVLVDIDHDPDHLLDGRSEGFYHVDGLQALKGHLKPGGVFGLWSDKPTDPRFLERLSAAFPKAWAEPVTFDNPLTGNPFTQTVYLAQAETD
ncbi:MAG: spermidine synthase [Rhizobiales bacterium]|nr:spermidine synthase [Hyphomicrobiales bacterium]MBO6698772.1 spermidine synthase [Hyphomicrobiales bacterium]MBO6734975.1 spermidine synthase [Hyphomicrobiales bacterium]MBO6911219.1 spermidine synthase [Hyphomicrobiales bacterium]MBO6955777.1 spermidine synthase [Hyphomicrobiales bacterium]